MFDEKRGFTAYQKILLSVTEDISNFAKWYFLSFRKRLQQKSRRFLYSLQEFCVLLLKNVLQSLERFIVALCRSFVIDLL